VLLALSLGSPDSSFALTRSECERDYRPAVGQAGKDVIWVPTPDETVQRMLGMARVTARDTVFDLGAGDGKIAIAAGRLGATAVGIEYNPNMANLANCMAQAEGVGSKARIIQGDIFKEDFSKATVVTMYLLPQLNLCVRHRILAMRPGTRVVSNSFDMGEWKPDQTTDREGRTVLLWVVPARVEGIWSFRLASGEVLTVDLRQTFQSVSGDVLDGANRLPLSGLSLRGDELRFSFTDSAGMARVFSGQVRGAGITGALQTGTASVKATGSVQVPLRAADWAEILPECKGFYQN